MFDIDSTIVALGYAFLVLAGLVAVVAAAGIVAAVRELGGTRTDVVVTVTGPERELSRAA